MSQSPSENESRSEQFRYIATDLAKKIALRYPMPPVIDEEDLEQEGWIAIWSVVDSHPNMPDDKLASLCYIAARRAISKQVVTTQHRTSYWDAQKRSPGHPITNKYDGTDIREKF